MISEAKKNLVFNINCYYQIVGLQKDIQSGGEVSGPIEITIFKLNHDSGTSVDWQKLLNNLLTTLRSSGFSDDWILQLSQCTANFTRNVGSIHQFRQKFMKSIDELLEMIQITATHLAHNNIEQFVNSIVGDIFDKDYWEDTVVNQIATIRNLRTELGFSKEWVIEFVQAYMKL